MSIEDIFAMLKKQRAPAPQGPVEYIIAGLGNPGDKYAGTRHNIGFMAVDALAEKNKFDIKKIKFKALIADAVINGKRCIVMKPSTFMNNSGEAIRECADFYKIPPEKVLVIFDDVSLDAGKLRIRRKGSAGGHNGIKSIIYHLQSDEFPRIKIGVGQKPTPEYDMVSWVLGTIPKADEEALKSALDKAVSAAETIVGGSVDEAMNKYNS